MFQDALEKLKMSIIGVLGYMVIKLLSLTIRIEWVNKERIENLIEKKGERVIYCFWHERLLLMPLIALGQKVTIMISQHRDGEYISRVLTWFGFQSVRGSATRGGSLALRKMVKSLRSGWHGAITPDGPKGPRHISKEGAVLLASLTGSPLIPVSFSSSKKKHCQPGINS